MLAIEVAFLTGRYVATAYNSWTQSEWPPHPARLFSALVATHFADSSSAADAGDERAALEWLERQGAPQICASEATAREVVTVYVPVNDVALTNVDAEDAECDEARLALESASDDSRKDRAKAVRQAEAALKKAIVEATSVPRRPMASQIGQRVLPEHRPRYPRGFPSMTPETPRVTYIWSEASPRAEERSALDALLRRVVRLGHSSTLVSLRLADAPDAPTWIPRSDGEIELRAVDAGQVGALERKFAQHQETIPRLLPYRPQRYSRSTRLTDGVRIPTSVFSDRWIVLRRVSGPHLPMTAAAGVARQVRRALMSYAEPIPEVISGHTADKSPSPQPHLAIVPLPFVGHEHASGLLIGVALALPVAASDGERRVLYQAIEKWEAAFRQEDENAPTVLLHLGEAGDFGLERVEWQTVPTSLRAPTWCHASYVWSSVTPVALDQNPGDLHGRDQPKLAAALAEASESISLACERVDLPRPASVEILPSGRWAGAAKARHYPPFPDNPARTQRVLTHARITFAERVRGPILLGAGRFVGLGLFRPEQ